MRAALAVAALAVLVWPAVTAHAQAQPPGARAGLRYLDWPGKAQTSAPAAGLRPALHVQTAHPAPRPMAASFAVAQPAAPIAPVAPTSSAFAPSSIYDAPPPQPMMIAQGAPMAPAANLIAMPAAAVVPAAPASSANDQARRYSLHRDYGEQPDRTPIPAPVFLDNLPVDLAAPPPADASRREAHDAKDAAENPETPSDPDDGTP